MRVTNTLDMWREVRHLPRRGPLPLAGRGGVCRGGAFFAGPVGVRGAAVIGFRAPWGGEVRHLPRRGPLPLAGRGGFRRVAAFVAGSVVLSVTTIIGFSAPAGAVITNSLPRSDTWVTNGRVSAMVRKGNDIYIGGQFST